MTDVWKSNARKFCEICKVWFADNRVSIEHHEGGQKHKAAIQAKLRELGKQSTEKERAKLALEATLAMMESAARSSMKLGTETSQAELLPCTSIGPMLKPKNYLDPRAHKASIAEMAKEMARRKKEYRSRKEKKNQDDSETQEVKCSDVKLEAEEPSWVEAVTSEGVPYYFHMYTGESTWQAPSSFLTAEQYSLRCSALSTVSPENIEVASELAGSGVGSHEFLLLSQPKEESVDSIEDTAPKTKEITVKFELSVDEGIAIAANFRLEDADIPLPPAELQSSSAFASSCEDFSLKQNQVEVGGTTSDGDSLSVDRKETLVEQTNDQKEDGSIIKDERKIVTQEAGKSETTTSASIDRRDHPFGAWTRVEKRPESPKIDYNLPTEAEGRKVKADVEIRPEDIVDFAEKTAPVCRKKKAIDAPAEFKKRRTNLSIRKRESVN